MAATALKIPKGNSVDHYVLIVTLPGEVGTDIAIHTTDPEYIIDSNLQPHYGVSELDEEEYHKQLRVGANSEGHFVPEFSTNPEWNPGVEETEATDGENGGD